MNNINRTVALSVSVKTIREIETELDTFARQIFHEFQQHPLQVRSHVVMRAGYGCGRKQWRTKDDTQGRQNFQIESGISQ